MDKVCISCGAKKNRSEFYKNTSYSDGYEGRCKECRKQYQKKWRSDNRDKHRSYSREYYANHTNERKQYYSEWRKVNGDRKAEYDREWRKANPKRMLARRKVENARRRARLATAVGNYSVDEWLSLKKKHNNTCLKCGRGEPEVKITPDHVIPLARGGDNTIGNIQPLCWNCNAAKQARIVDYR